MLYCQNVTTSARYILDHEGEATIFSLDNSFILKGNALGTYVGESRTREEWLVSLIVETSSPTPMLSIGNKYNTQVNSPKKSEFNVLQLVKAEITPEKKVNLTFERTY